MKKNVLNIFLFIFMTFAACSSPEKDGTSLGKKINKCNEDFLNALNKIEADFGKGSSYQTRSEAKQAYFEAKEQACTDYSSALGDVYKKMSETQRDYKDYKDRTKFEDAVEAAIDSDLLASATASANSSDVPKAVLAVIRTIVSPKPDAAQIQKDLVGHSLSEGVDDGYYPSYWKWKIEEGEISNFNIESVLANSSAEYQFVAKMRLTSKVGKAFDATVRIRYLLPDDDDWTIEFVRSQGMYVVKTHQYDDCVKCVQDGWWKYLKNSCEVTLEVGGRKYNCGSWTKFSCDVPPHGSYNLYNPDEVIIDYTERP